MLIGYTRMSLLAVSGDPEASMVSFQLHNHSAFLQERRLSLG
jgi:hypothetical protein